MTEFEFQLHPFDRNVFSGIIAWPVAQAGEVLGFYAGDPAAGEKELQPLRAVGTPMEDGTFAHGVRSYAKNGMAKEFTHDLAKAFPHRNAGTMIAVGGGWMDPAMDDEVIAIARNWFRQLAPFTGGYHSNIDFDSANAGGKNYGPAYKRLSEIKGRYDPANLFRLNRNILPAA